MRPSTAKSLSSLATITLLVLGNSVLAAPGTRSFGPVGFLTGPQSGPPLEIALGYLERNLAELGLTAADLDGMVVKDHYRTRHNGTTHIYLRQVLDGIEVRTGDINVNVAADGSIINLGNRFVADLAAKVDTRSPAISDRQAIAAAAGHFGLGFDPQSLALLRDVGGPERRATFAGTGLSRDDIPVHLVYEQLRDGRVRLAWRTLIDLLDSPDWWELRVDAVTGEVISQSNWTDYDSYLVVPLPPFENPEDSGGAMMVADPADPVASPFGWHDTDGAAGAEFTDTQGNNVDAHDDLDGDNGLFTPGLRPDGGAGLDFLFPWDSGLDPDQGTNLEAAIVNLFYANNVMHDLTYHYGFDEAAGNFQTNNYGRGGLGGDQLEADAQDGSGTNNADFRTPPDGFPPRMQMYVWTPEVSLRVNSPGNIAGEYVARSADFGPALDSTGVTGTLEYANDGEDAGGSGTENDGCEPLVGFTAGNVALIDRGLCDFSLKVYNAQEADAIATVIANDRPGLVGMAPGDNAELVTISSLMITQEEGDTIKAELGTGVNATLRALGDINRDSDMDNGIIAHEYGHGISNRLTGGPATSGCLGGDEQAGEGWSDFWTLVLTAKPEHTPSMPRGVGNYPIFQDASGTGIRNFPYTTDMSVNPQTYADIGTTNVPHGVGEIWMSMLWEVYWELVVRHGFDEDLYHGSGGNNLAIQLVVDGMKLQPCLPDFVEARDAILLADINNNGGANQCELWRGFAKRGLGVNADAGVAGDGLDVGDETEDFTVPDGCCSESFCLFLDGFESGDTSAWSSSSP